MSSPKIREATHAGSWYSGDSAVLGTEISRWLDTVKTANSAAVPQRNSRIIIGPHAGYRFCAQTGAYSFASLDNDAQLVYVLGVSHHVPLSGAYVSPFKQLNTPFGQLQVSSEALNELGLPLVSEETDEEEHSIEMHLPFLAKVAPNAKIVPILVGSVNENQAHEIGMKLAQRLQRDSKAAISVSSDFCHWGERFGYTFVNSEWKQKGEGVWKSVEKLDRLGIEEICTGEPIRFAQYMQKYRNTICGRNGIIVALNAAKISGQKFDINLAAYSQSSSAMTMRDSSVSYAAIRFIPNY